MKRASFFLLASLLLFATPFVWADKPKGDPMVKHVDAKEAGKLWKANKDKDDFVVLDVRTAEEFAEGHIPHAVNVDVLSSAFAAKAAKLDKETSYLIHCRSGKRSQTALKQLKKLGFLKLYHLDGGIMAWEDEGLDVKKAKKD